MIRLILAAALALFALPSLAQEPRLARGIFCDTAEQIKEFANQYAGDANAALESVNEKAGKADACVAAIVFVIVGARHGRISTPQGDADIGEVIVIAAMTPEGPRQIEPMIQFTLLPPETPEQGA